MKKRIVSTLLALCMLLCLMPTAAFAEGSTETPPVCSCETACTAESMNADCPVCGAHANGQRKSNGNVSWRIFGTRLLKYLQSRPPLFDGKQLFFYMRSKLLGTAMSIRPKLLRCSVENAIVN